MKVTFTKEEARQAILTEPLLSEGEWISNTSRLQGKCYVCAVGAVLREKIRFDAYDRQTLDVIISNITEERANGLQYGMEDGDTKPSEEAIQQGLNEISHNAIKAVEYKHQLLSALSGVFESYATYRGLEVGRAMAAKLIEDHFPDTFEVNIPEGILKT